MLLNINFDQSKMRHRTILAILKLIEEKKKEGYDDYQVVWFVYERYIQNLLDAIKDLEGDDWEDIEGSYYPYSKEEVIRRVHSISESPLYLEHTKVYLRDLHWKEYEYVNS